MRFTAKRIVEDVEEWEMQIRLISGCLEPITEFRRTVSSVAHPAEANAYGAI